MVSVPADTPYNVPVVASIEAIDALLLAHVPPPMLAVSTEEVPADIELVPEIVAEAEVVETVSDVTALAVPQVVVKLYVMPTVPAETPVTKPQEVPNEAIDGLLELQVPPGVAIENLLVLPPQIEAGPIMESRKNPLEPTDIVEYAAHPLEVV
jgi:hypothetical protein